jgi:hypothetical protein
MSGDQVGIPIRLPTIRASWWRRLLCGHPQRSTWRESGRWHRLCLDCGAAWRDRSWQHWEIGRQPTENDTTE